MEPRIQYAQTKDGVNIAYRTMGEGEPLVYMPASPVSHIELEWQVLGNREWLAALARNRTLIHYDGRGCGLSSGDVTTLSIDTCLLDLQAIVDRLQLDRFALFGPSFTGPAAIAYAARNADRVSRLILWCTVVRGADMLGAPRDRILGAMMEADWDLYTETVANLTYGWSAGDPVRQFAARIRETLTPEKMKAAYREIARMDAGEFISQVRSPTLVLHRPQIPFMGAGAPRSLAAGIGDARLVLLEGDSALPYSGDTGRVLQAIDEFLGEGEKPPMATPGEAGAFRTILFTDVADSTPLTQRLGDAAAREVLRAHERITREALREHGGSEVKTMGDGFMASFSSATRALECATAMQRAFAEQNASAEETVLVRVGLNAGEPIEEEEDLFGTSVIMAARIAAKAQGGEIMTSNVIRELVAGKGFLFSDRGDAVLRGFEDPVRLYEVRWREEE